MSEDASGASAAPETSETSETYDAVVIGAGIGGATCAQRLCAGGLRVALVERDRLGGETAYWAAIPSRTLLGPANPLWRMQVAAGIASPSVAGPGSGASANHLPHLDLLDDAAQVERLEQQGIRFLRGAATLTGPGRIQVGAHTLATRHCVIATGRQPNVPTIDGLAQAGYWTPRDAATSAALPTSVVMLGARGSLMIELAQRFRLYGANVTLVVSADRLVPQEDAAVGALLMEYLTRSGVRVALGRTAVRVERDAQGLRTVTLDDGTQVQSEGVLVEPERAPRLEGLGLERAGVQTTRRGIQTDAYCRAADGIWAVGDVTGVASSLHMTQYQARLAADDILGHPHPAHYESVPRITFAQPQIAATGLTLDQAQARGVEVVSYTAELITAASTGIARQQKRTLPELNGRLTLHADRARGVLIGAWAVDANAGEWIQLAALAIRAGVPLSVLHDTLEQFPTFSEVYLAALDQLTAIT